MGRLILNGNPPIEVNLRRSARARRLSLRISRLNGRVTLTLPKRTSEREGIAFARDREEWLRQHLDGIEAVRPVQFGESILYRGQEFDIVAADQRRITVGEGAICLPNDPDRVATRLKAFLKTQARDALAAASDRYAAQLGKSYNKLTLRDTRSRWGSCSSRGDLMYSWRLIMAPPEVLDYVAAHEVAHLLEMNHSDAFWALCADLYPDHKTARAWLKNHGNALHRWSFEN